MNDAREEEPVDELDERFRAVLRAHNAEFCPDCGRHLNRMDAAWNEAATEEGTPYSMLEVICAACSAEIACVRSWHPWIDTFEKFIEVLKDDWKQNPR